MDVAEFVEIMTEPVPCQTAETGEARQTGQGDTTVKLAGAVGAQPAFVAPAGECQFNNTMGDGASDFLVYHRQFAGLKTPFDMPIECFPEYAAMLDEDPDCVDAVNIMLQGSVAKSTACNYKTVVVKFHAYCAERGHVFPGFESSAVLRFVKDCYAEGAGLSFFGKVLPALALLEEVLGAEKTALTGVVRQAVSGIKRELARTRGVVKKATGYSFQIIQYLVEKEVVPFWGEPHKINATHFRSLFRAVIIYCTLCRFDEFSRLQDKHFADKGDHVEVVFERRKNDQFGDNSKAVIPARPDTAVCPVELIRLYFRTFHLQFQGSGKSVNFRIQKQAGSHRPLWNTSLAQSNATKLTRELLVKHGFDGAKFTEKSLKVQGVTELLDAGESLENVMVLGCWKRTTTPLHYRHMSTRFLLSVASRIPM